MYIYENKSWPKFTWRIEELTDLLSKVSFLQGNLLGNLIIAILIMNNMFISSIVSDKANMILNKSA